MKLIFLILFFLLTLLRCSSPSGISRENNSGLSAEEIKSDPNYPLAVVVDSELRGIALDSGALKLAITDCQQSSSPLCSVLGKLKTLKQLYSQKNKVYTPQQTRPLAPLMPIFHQGKVSNWTQLRKAPVPNLLKGLLAASRDQLLILAEKAQSETKCPNNVAVAIAATLEDYLPENTDFSLFAKLYESGGACRNVPANDKENYLTRSGLFYFLKKDFSKAISVLSKVKPTDAFSGRSTFWLYRASKEIGNSQAASTYLKKLAVTHRFSFHHLVASHLEQQEAIPEFNRSLTFNKRSDKHKRLNRFIESVEILNRLNFQQSAHILVDWLLTQPVVLEPEVRVYLSQLGDAHAKVVQLPGLLMFHPNLISRETIKLNFPEAYSDFFQKYAKDVNPYLLVAIARRESSFNPKAVSPANAQGLLQLNPETVKLLFPDHTFDLLDPETNISLASQYVAKVRTEMNGNLPALLASYNAGEAQVHTWQKRYPTADRMLWIDLIPYRETRDYVANVLNSYHWYRKLYENSSDFRDLFP